MFNFSSLRLFTFRQRSVKSSLLTRKSNLICINLPQFRVLAKQAISKLLQGTIFFLLVKKPHDNCVTVKVCRYDKHWQIICKCTEKVPTIVELCLWDHICTKLSSHQDRQLHNSIEFLITLYAYDLLSSLGVRKLNKMDPYDTLYALRRHVIVSK